METLETAVCVHSPVIEYSMGEGYYTSYAIHLTSTNPCFSIPSSHVRRRYSEFSRLREMLAVHHPSLTPPLLPPKNYFHRFKDNFIDQRMKGLQKFLEELLCKPVYLSEKCLHMFLQSTSSMSAINKECMGDIPAPLLIQSSTDESSHSEKSSTISSSDQEEEESAKSKPHFPSEDSEMKTQEQKKTSRTDFQIPSSLKSSLISSIRYGSKPFLIPMRNGSLDSSAASSLSGSQSSVDMSNSFCSGRSKERRVSFNERVKIAIVTTHGISVLRP